MELDRILFPIKSLGPGNRIVIWTLGCTKYCYKCTNPELWEKNKEKTLSIESIKKIITSICNKYKIDGFTITGGDPLEQFHDLLPLLQWLNTISKDILVYTGYNYRDFCKSITLEEKISFEKSVGVLIDGPYIDSLNSEDCILRGSLNQQILFFNDDLKELYNSYLSESRKIQNIYYKEKLISVGIHNRTNLKG